MTTAYRSVKITLVENSSAGNSPNVFLDQTVEIVREPDTVKTSVDGFVSTGKHPSKVFWRGGTAKCLANITDVRIVSGGGEVLVDGQIVSNFQPPQDISGGVKFEILQT